MMITSAIALLSLVLANILIPAFAFEAQPVQITIVYNDYPYQVEIIMFSWEWERS